MDFTNDLDLFLEIYKEDTKRYDELLKIKDTILKFRNGKNDTPNEQVKSLINVYCLFTEYTPEKFDSLFTLENYSNNDNDSLKKIKENLLKTLERMRTTIFEFSRKHFV